MEVVFALLADAANVSQEGKLNILGSFADVYANEFPARHPQMQLVLRLEASPAEVDLQKKFEVQLADQDGEKISGLQGTFTVPKPHRKGEYVHMQTVVRMIDTVFPTPGRYAIYVLIDGKTEATVPITVGVKPDGNAS